jgi:hypothetical protein
MTFTPQFLLARALRHRQQAARARRLARTVPQDAIAARLLEMAGALDSEASRDEQWARGILAPEAEAQAQTDD